MGHGASTATRKGHELWEEAVSMARKEGLDFDERDIASISASYRDKYALIPRFLDPTHSEKFDYNIIRRIATIFKHRLECVEPMMMMYLNRYYAQLTASVRRGYVAKHAIDGETVLLLQQLCCCGSPKGDLQHPTDPGCHLGRGVLLPVVVKGNIMMAWSYGVMACSKYRLMVKIPVVRDGILLRGCGASVSNPS